MNDSSQKRPETAGLDDMEQVRQLLLGDHQAMQERQIASLQNRVAELEKLVEALIAHGDASRRAWQSEISAARDSATRTSSAARSVSQQVTPLTPRNNRPDDVKDD